MDQLASVGITFQDDYIDKIFAQNVQYYENPPKTPTTLSTIFAMPTMKQWAIKSVYDKHKPVRPWGLGKIYNSETGSVWHPLPSLLRFIPNFAMESLTGSL